MDKNNWNSVDQSRFSSLRRSYVISMVVILVLCFQANFVSAQELSPSFVPVAPEALSNAFVRCFYKDSRGYMWIGTEDALIRYDGSNAHRYMHDPHDKTTIAHNTINTILEGKDNLLWIGTAQGLCIYDRERDNFINVDSIPGNQSYLSNRYITDIEFDPRGRLWIGTHEGGINIYDYENKKFEYIIDPPQGGVLPSSNFINILRSVNDTMWCATKGGLLLYDTRTNEALALPSSLERFSNAQISAIVREKSGTLLMATVTGEITRLIFSNAQYTAQVILYGKELGESANSILALGIDRENNILVGGENSGFNTIDRKTHAIRSLADEIKTGKHLPTNSVESIYVDDLGLIWIGTQSNGAFLLDNKRKKFETSERLLENLPFENKDVRSFAEDRQGNIWIASYGAGLFKINSGNNVVQPVTRINKKINNKNVTSIICDRNGLLWLGTAGSGVYKIDPDRNHIENYSLASEGFGNDQVFCLYENKNGTIWAGTWGSGLFFFDAHNHNFISATEYDQPNHIPNTAYVSDILEDSEGTLWIGTLYGLYELQRRTDYSFTYRVYLPENGNEFIPGAQIQMILEDRNKDLWVGTTEGLSLKKRGSSQFINYQMEKGPMFNTIRSLLLDAHGNVWIGGNIGLSKFDVSSKTFIQYTREDGLKSNNFHRRSSLASSSGKFYFGSNNGFDSFFPDSIRTTSTKAKVLLSDLKINNQSVKPGAPGSPLKRHISLTSELELSYEQRSFVIDFVALDHSQSSSYNYFYKLEGFDNEWKRAGSDRSATYTNIDPGRYVFFVKASNRDGIWIDHPLRIDITIQQVFWKTWWAFCIYAGILILLIYITVRIRIERLKLKSEIKFEKLTREQEQKLSESKTQFFTNVAHEFRTPLSLIMIPLESLMETSEVPAGLRARIYTAHKNASRMMRLVNELLEFNKLEAGSLKLNVQHGELVQFITETSSAFTEMAALRKISFSVKSDTPNIMGWFDRDKVERMIFNVLSNAFKFTADGGEIRLNIDTKYSIIPDGTLCRCIEIVIEDNGIGISQEELPRIFEKFYQAESSSKIASPGTGIGLSLTKALVELHHGTITVESVPDHATLFTIILPVDANVYHIMEDVETPPEVIYYNYETDFFLSGEQENHDEQNVGDKPTILVAEDNSELRVYLVAELRAEFTVIEAKDGEEGRALSLEKNPDLIISDIMMPIMGGIEFCDAIKSDLNTSHIPFILLTAKATVEDQIKGIRTGADLYISKPFNVRYLIAHIHQIISSRRRLYARFSQDVYLTPGKAATNALDQEFLQKAIDYVTGNLQDPQLSVDSIAALFNLSRMQVYRKIKALTGKSVVEFIRMVRMKQAIKLMDSHKFTLSEIAFEVGFNSASYFTRVFKDEYGKTPSEYLDQLN